VWIEAALQGDGLRADSAAVLDWGRRRMAKALRSRSFSDPDVDGLPPAEAGVLRGAARDAGVDAFRLGMGVSGGLLLLGGLVGAAGIRNPRRVVLARDCSGGQWAGQPAEVANEECVGVPARAAAPGA
jgi:hypothetical protein